MRAAPHLAIVDLVRSAITWQQESQGAVSDKPKVLVCGGRDFDHRATVYAKLDRLHPDRPFGAVIAGGSRGLGRVIAQKFVEEGANVLLCAREQKTLLLAERELKAAARSGRWRGRN